MRQRKFGETLHSLSDRRLACLAVPARRLLRGPVQRSLAGLLMAAALLAASPAWAQWFVQSCNAVTASSTSTSCMLNSVGARHALIAAAWSGGSSTTNTVSDSASDSWSRVAARAFVSGIGGFDVWATCSSAGGNITITLTTSATTNPNLIVHEVGGLASSSCADQNANANGPGTAIASASVTTTQAAEYLFGVGVIGGSTNVVTANSPWTGRVSNAGASTTGVPMSTEDSVVSATGSFATSFTGGSSGTWNSTIVTFKGATCKCPPTCIRLLGVGC